MSYLALYREWRPRNFKDMVGQGHVKITLLNALRQDKVAHAYLFSGPRGTGKTTAAKILAKALNCSSPDGVEPCNLCHSCQGIEQGIALDVLEIDAASNRGIDEIRDLREKVKLASSGGKYKVYIIDEVHMLTTEAFNALLKTLEEPPAQVVFILATTEAHKLPLTILSRVQRLEFHRIPPNEIVGRLHQVCKEKGRTYEERAIEIIALKAEGGLRDALSILDQCLLLEGELGLEQVYQVIGMVGEEFSADLVDCFIQGDYGKALSKLGEGIQLGRDPRQIIKDLLDYLRQALLYKAGGQEPHLSAEVKTRMVLQCEQAGLLQMLSWIHLLLKGEGEMRYASNARLAAEMVLIQGIYGADPLQNTEETSVRKPVSPAGTSQVQGRVQKTTVAHTGNVQYPLAPLQTEGKKEAETDTKTDFAQVKARWPQILEEVRQLKRSTHAFLLQAQVMDLRGNNLYLIFKDGFSFHRDKFNIPENKEVVEEVIAKAIGAKLEIQPLMESEYKDRMAQTFVPEVVEPAADGVALKQEEEMIQKAVELFGAELVQVRKD